MATNSVIMGAKLRDIDRRILDVLHEGRNIPSNIADELGVTRQYIQQRLQVLEAGDHVENVGRGVYGVIDDPRDSEGSSDESDEQATDGGRVAFDRREL